MLRFLALLNNALFEVVLFLINGSSCGALLLCILYGIINFSRLIKISLNCLLYVITKTTDPYIMYSYNLTVSVL